MHTLVSAFVPPGFHAGGLRYHCMSPLVSHLANENEKDYSEYFNLFKFELSDFQKWSIKAIIEGNHSLITAHTGSGKTLPAEFAIDFFHKKGKKVI